MKLRSSESTGGDAQQERLPGFLDRVIADYPRSVAGVPATG